MILMLAAMIVAYGLGSCPTGFLVARLIKGIDIRRHGSGNVGATNTARVVGALPGLFVLAVDIAKGWVAAGPLVIWSHAAGLRVPPETAQAVFGLCAVCGHIWSPFLAFRGGKGVATAAGVLVGLSPALAGVAVAVWIAVAAATRYVSVSSIAAVTAVPIVMAITNCPLSWIVVGATLCVIIVAKHRANMVRLLRHEEHRLGPPARRI
ncbi:MAG: glycerol-3-phosphate 1-O-acyltransferase PlsY [Candidatus Omnitrophica bacterium]|nr:glycerol-3-phosphate 1-O-acyltransferase PlsY [Candidatus Omnitrophota bacterium]